MKIHIFLIATIYVLFSEKLIKWTTASTTQGGDTDTHQGTPPGEGSDVSQGAGQDASQGAGQDANPDPTLPKPPSPPADDTKDTGSQGDADSSSSKIEIPPLVKPENHKTIVSAMLKNYKGVKVTGTCGADFGLFLVPHIYVHVKSEDTEIELSSELAPPEMQTKFDKTQLKNFCVKDDTKKFDFIAYIYKDILVFKWKVYKEGLSKEQDVDEMKYLLPNLKQPITSIQVHSWTGTKESYILESKDYVLGEGMPEKCDAIATDCFLSGFTDIGKCFQCKLLMQEKNINDSCFKYVSSNQKELIKKQLKITAQDDEESSEYHLSESIKNLLKNIYKKNNDDNKKKELLHFENVNSALKSELLNYCNLLKEVNMNGVLKDHQLGNVQDVFNNLTKLLEEHKEENDNVLYHKMKNEALCLKNVNDWMKNKTGLLLPQLSYDLTYKNNNFTEFTQNKSYTSQNIVDKLYCNHEYCNRLKDHNNCISKINVEDQKNCALSWAFAHKEHDIYNYYLKTSPEFYHNLYYKTFNSNKEEKSMNKNSYVYGQDTTPVENKAPRSGVQKPTELSSTESQTVSPPNGSQTESLLSGGSQVTNPTLTQSTSSSSGQQETGPLSTQGLSPATGDPKGKEQEASPAEGLSGVLNPTKEVTSEEKIQIIHLLKHIKNSKIRRGLVKYNHEFEVGDNSCSRSTSKNAEMHDECVNICEKYWPECRGTAVPGYCLSTHDDKNECDFCYV
ncbi:hypothetical protein C923_00240 [Plasmodium falciparum UGT5.1]|uniref:Uncharacterized protein n=1 Tax=Plasmodium falciparum UGT5.1 TaxID=1237627 RepID=W7JVI8_PLAFA|nr:hypothetical protein C923_00240 [Plasmodium falciparum UGT5.1]